MGRPNRSVRVASGDGLLIAALTVVVALAVAASAAACSCAPPGDPREDLADADAAVYGTIVGRKVVRDPSGPRIFGDETVRYRLRVVRDYKDNLGTTVDVRSTVQESACGLPFRRRGQRIGLLLYRDRGHWGSSLCSTRTRAQLAAGRVPLPAPTGTPPARLLIGGAFGTPRIAALDATGALLGFGDGTGGVEDLAVCPGGRTVLEMVRTENDRHRLVPRAVDSLMAGPGVPLRLARGSRYEFPDGLECTSEDGSTAVVLTTNRRFLRVEAGLVRELARIRGYGVLLGDTIFTRTRAYDATTGAERPFGPLPRHAELADRSPDGATLVAVGPSDVILLDATTGAVVRRVHRPARAAEWVDDGALAVFGSRRVVFLDRALRTTGAFVAGYATFGVPDGGGLVTITEGVLERHATDGTRIGRPVRLFTSAVDVLAACVTRSPATAATAPAT